MTNQSKVVDVSLAVELTVKETPADLVTHHLPAGWLVGVTNIRLEEVTALFVTIFVVADEKLALPTGPFV